MFFLEKQLLLPDFNISDKISFYLFCVCTSLTGVPISLRLKSVLFLTFYFVLGYNQLTDNLVIVSGEQQRNSAKHIHVSILPQTSLLKETTHNIQTPCQTWKGIELDALVSCLRQKDRNKTTRHQQRELGGPGPLGPLPGESWGHDTEGTKSDEKLLIYFLHASSSPWRGWGAVGGGYQQPWAPLLSLHLHQRPALMQLK